MNTSTIESFLQKTGPGVIPTGTVTVVMGNEAADLDSMASAFLFAYYLFRTEPEANPRPLINIPRGDFKLRTEAVFLFREAGIDESLLNFSDDLDLEKLADKQTLKLVLVDHNKLASSQARFEGLITAILDHHADEGSYPKTAAVDIRPVGSTATIVAERFLENAPDALDSTVGTLLLGTILLDTVNLDPEAGRVTDADRAVVEKLATLTGKEPQALFDKLQFEKFNVSSLGSYDLLRKDYKEWQMGSVKCGISSVLLSAQEWRQKDPDLTQAFRQYVQERRLDMLLAMNAFTTPTFTRQLGVYVREDDLRRRLLEFLKGSNLELEPLEGGGDEDALVFFRQNNLGMSRKKLQPLLSDLFTG